MVSPSYLCIRMDRYVRSSRICSEWVPFGNGQRAASRSVFLPYIFRFFFVSFSCRFVHSQSPQTFRCKIDLYILLIFLAYPLLQILHLPSVMVRFVCMEVVHDSLHHGLFLLIFFEPWNRGKYISNLDEEYLILHAFVFSCTEGRVYVVLTDKQSTVHLYSLSISSSVQGLLFTDEYLFCFNEEYWKSGWCVFSPCNQSGK